MYEDNLQTKHDLIDRFEDEPYLRIKESVSSGIIKC